MNAAFIAKIIWSIVLMRKTIFSFAFLLPFHLLFLINFYFVIIINLILLIITNIQMALTDFAKHLWLWFLANLRMPRNFTFSKSTGKSTLLIYIFWCLAKIFRSSDTRYFFHDDTTRLKSFLNRDFSIFLVLGLHKQTDSVNVLIIRNCFLFKKFVYR